MRNLILLILVPIAILQSCDVVDSFTFRSYVNTYYNYNDISLSITDSGNIAINGATFDKQYTWKSKGRDKEIYDSLCVLHNDMGYNKKRDYIVGTDWGHCNVFDINHIIIKSNAAYDNQHPSGASLNDIVRFISVSPQKFIESNYSLTFDWDLNMPNSFKKERNMANFKNNNECVNFFPVDKKLSEIGANELKLLMPEQIGYFIFESNPTLEKKHKFSITFELSNDKTIIKSIDKTFN